MKIITRTIAIKNLKKHIGQDLRELALKHGITTYETGKQNKLAEIKDVLGLNYF